MKPKAFVVAVRRCSVSMIAAAGLLLANPAASAVVSLGSGTVTWIETTYMPGTIVFTLSSGDTLCPAGTNLHYISSNVDNMKAVYATLLANLLSGRQIYAYYETTTVNSGVPPGNCRVQHLGTR
jgi:hypothetical protein